MYQSLQMKNFRCFRNLILTELERVNLITGMNNVGKTALLEALFLHCGAYNPGLALKLNVFRGLASAVEFGAWAEAPWAPLFRGFDAKKEIEIIGENTATGRRVLRLAVPKPSEMPPELRLVRQESGVREETPHYGESPRALGTPEVAKVLRLEYEQEGMPRGFYFLIWDLGGIRLQPSPPAPPFPAFFQGARMRIPFKEEAERFGKLEIYGKQDVILQVLRLLEPELKRLAIVVEGGEPILHGDVGAGRMVPLPLMGEGMVRLASLALHIGNAQGGVVLVDEIENGLHYSVLPKVWKAIGEVARQFDTQVFATTHSRECIVAAHSAFSEGELYDFRLHRLERVGEDIRAVTYDRETLDAALESGLEVR